MYKTDADRLTKELARNAFDLGVMVGAVSMAIAFIVVVGLLWLVGIVL